MAKWTSFTVGHPFLPAGLCITALQTLCDFLVESPGELLVNVYNRLVRFITHIWVVVPDSVWGPFVSAVRGITFFGSSRVQVKQSLVRLWR